MESDPGAPETPAVPTELTGQLPRRTRLTGNGIKTVITAAILFLLPTVLCLQFGIHTLQLRRQETALRRSGSETTGEIKRVWVPSGSSAHWVSYNFAVKGANFKGEARVPKQLLQTVKNSYTLPVRYLPGNPAVNHPAEWKGSPRWHWVVIVIPIILGVVFGVMMLLLLGGQRELLVKGTPALAAVTKCSRSRNGFMAKYEFRTSEGIVTQGAGWCKNQQEIGAKIWVLYLPRNPQASRPYPVPAFRVALP